MRLTVNLDPDLYGLAKSLAREADCSISVAVNRLLRRALPSGTEGGPRPERPRKRNGFAISRGRRLITAETVRRVEAEDDDA
jgi:hypothetical protein